MPDVHSVYAELKRARAEVARMRAILEPPQGIMLGLSVRQRNEAWSALERVTQERDEARTATERVRALHTSVTHWTGPLTYRAQCGHCASLCHSRSGLGCDDPDAAWPCETIQALDGPASPPEPDLRGAGQWQAEMPEVRILDPDGWRGLPWDTPISRDEYLRRRSQCTIETNATWPEPTENLYREVDEGEASDG